MKFKDQLKKLRKEKNLTQLELADKLFVTRQAITNWENGRGIPNYDILVKLSKIFDCDVSELVDCEKEEIVDLGKKKRSLWLILPLTVLINLIVVGFISYFSYYFNYTQIQKIDGYYISTKEEVLDLANINQSIAYVSATTYSESCSSNVARLEALKCVKTRIPYNEEGYYIYRATTKKNKTIFEKVDVIKDIKTYQYTLENLYYERLEVEIIDCIEKLEIELFDVENTSLFVGNVTQKDYDLILNSTSSYEYNYIQTNFQEYILQFLQDIDVLSYITITRWTVSGKVVKESIELPDNTYTTYQYQDYFISKNMQDSILTYSLQFQKKQVWKIEK